MSVADGSIECQMWHHDKNKLQKSEENKGIINAREKSYFI
jgi:hypothetical protein